MPKFIVHHIKAHTKEKKRYCGFEAKSTKISDLCITVEIDCIFTFGKDGWSQWTGSLWVDSDFHPSFHMSSVVVYAHSADA